MESAEKQQTGADARRGIQNTVARFARDREAGTLQERLLGSADDERFGTDPKNERRDEFARAQEMALQEQAEEQEAFEQRALAQQAMLAHQMQTQKGIAGIKKVPLGAFTRLAGLTALGMIAISQMWIAIASAVAFVLEGTKDLACSTAVVSLLCNAAETAVGIISKVTTVNAGALLSFINLAGALWAIILVITICVLAGYGMFFRMQGMRVFDTRGKKFFAIGMFAFNLVPFLNMISWISIWALVWMLRGIFENATSLSKSAPNVATARGKIQA